ncbi:MAG: hypothetical protein HY903_16530 [Deltaproteobacteria bacterium]|nr:hypothetical protein [Deltaproteobacteria bacterium]
MKSSRILRTVTVAGACGLVFELVALLDFSGARADDLDLLTVGGSGSSSSPPPNIVFLFDNSGSMNNLICEDLTGALECSASGLTARAGPNASTVCESPALRVITGPDVTGDGVTDVYRYLFDRTTPTSWRGYAPYPVYDARGSNANDDIYASATVHNHPANSGWTERAQGSGASSQAQIEDAIADYCATISDCRQKSRCIYSMRTQGYFWEATGCATGDPMGICAASPTTYGLGHACTVNGDCVSNRCYNSVCSSCTATGTGNCTGSGNSCVNTGCAHYFCSNNGKCQVPKSGTGSTYVGESCSSDGQCVTNHCRNDICSTCEDDDDCPGNNDDCTRDNGACAYYYCKGSRDCQVAGSGSSSGGSGPAFLGDFLNFYPPKSVALIKTFTETLATMTGDVRVGVADFDDIGSAGIAFDIKPPCSQSRGSNCFDGSPTTVCFNQADSQLLNYLHNTLTFNNRTPLAKALDQVGKYYSSSTGVDTPICDYSMVSACGDANNFVVVITDGLPFNDAAAKTDVPFVNGKISNMSDGYYLNNSYWLDDVAKALTQIDHRADITGTQRVNSYTVSFGLLDAADPTRCAGILDETAAAGGGKCLPARSVDELRAALQNIVSEIIKRARGFTAPSVPTTRLSGGASLQSAMFRPSTKFPLWEGHLFGFKVCDEKLGRATATPCECFNGANVNEVCVTDALGNAIRFDDAGNLISTPLWDAQLCLAGDIAGSYGVIDPDQGNLSVTGCYRAASETSATPPPRVIYTAVEHGGNANTYSNDDVIPFTLASLSNAGYGATFLARLGYTGNLAAGERIVGFYRGLDTGDIDSDGDVGEDRNLDRIRDGSGELIDGWWKLGDVFHSIPNVVERPTGRGLGAWSSTASYAGFMADHNDRKQVVLVAANDGMLHAFLVANWNGVAKAYLDAGPGGPEGAELWAFIAPEMLPKLKDLCNPSSNSCGLTNHRFMADGSVMVRDVWIGGAADKAVAANKIYWKTMAIYGHRQGGNSYVALDVTDVDNPRLLWVFPQANQNDLNSSPIANLMGETWLDVFPAPASIGPLNVDSDDNAATLGSHDRWVALLSAGYDFLDRKGRALFMLDAWSGDVVWMAQRSNSGVTTDMKYSFPATPVFHSSIVGSFPYIVGVVAADHGGQLWSITPAAIPSVASSGRYTMNMAVVFRTTATAGATDPVGGNNNSVLDANEYQHRPFFFAPTLTRNGNTVRVLIGTGDRDTLVPDPDRNTTINGYVCNAVNDDAELQRLYAIDLTQCVTAGTPRACTETDLAEIARTGATTFATENQHGWFIKLEKGEKVATPYDIFNGFALYATFLPTVGCGGSSGSSNACSPSAKGVARLYARHFLTGRVFDWNGDNAIVASEEIVDLGEGVPTAPAVSVGIGGGEISPTLFAGGSDSGLNATSATGMAAELVTEILHFPVSRGLHACLHAQTSCP